MSTPLRPQLPFDLQLPNRPRVSDPEAHRELGIVYASMNILGQQIGGLIAAPATEVIVPGAFVNMYNSAGALSIRNAISNTKLAHGILVASQNLAIGDSGQVQMLNTATYPAGGLVIGDMYYLDTATPGGITNVSPGGGNIQHIGLAISPTQLFLNLDKVFS